MKLLLDWGHRKKAGCCRKPGGASGLLTAGRGGRAPRKKERAHYIIIREWGFLLL